MRHIGKGAIFAVNPTKNTIFQTFQNAAGSTN